MKKKSNKLSGIIKTKLIDFLISLIAGIIVAIVGALFSFWLMKTYGFSFIGG